MILIGYDGSPDAHAAIDVAGPLMSEQEAVVLTVWERFVDVMTPGAAGVGLTMPTIYAHELDEYSENNARERAEEGAELARRAGLDARSRVCLRHGNIANTIMAEADAVDADVIVLGSRGLTGIKSILLGSVSHGVLQRADRPVVVVPSPEVAAERAAERRGGRYVATAAGSVGARGH